jgi:hypothetical protein
MSDEIPPIDAAETLTPDWLLHPVLRRDDVARFTAKVQKN